jgi:hypothetical protein
MRPKSSLKPVGQLLLLAEDFAGTPQLEVSTTVHDGVHRLGMAQAGAAAELQLLLTDKETNVFAVRASLTQLTRPFSVRVAHAEITARRDGLCAVMNPWPDRPLRILELPAETAVAFTTTQNTHQFAARAGTTYVLVCGLK